MFNFLRKNMDKRIKQLEARLQAMEEAQKAYQDELTNAVDAEVQRHIDDLDADSVVGQETLNELIADVLRDELSTCRVRISLDGS